MRVAECLFADKFHTDPHSAALSYPKIQEHQLDFLCNAPQILDVVNSEAFRAWIARVVQGEMPQSEQVMLTLFQSMAAKVRKLK